MALTVTNLFCGGLFLLASGAPPAQPAWAEPEVRSRRGVLRSVPRYLAIVRSHLHLARTLARAAVAFGPAMNFRNEERAAHIAGMLRKQLDLLLEVRDSSRVPTYGEAAQIRQNSATWRHHQLEKLRCRLTGLTIEPPTRVQ